jgi:hydrogenase-4 component B
VSVLLWVAPVLVPVLCAGMLALRPGPRISWLLVAAPLPAAVLAAVGDAVPAPRLDWLLLGVEPAVDDVARLLLLMTSLVWAAAGAYARAEAEAHRGYGVLWLLALAGNVGLLVAADVVTFYTAFVVMTFAAYGLVVHTRTDAARRAGRIYVVLAVVGETALLGALLLAVTEAPSLRLDDVAAAVAGSTHRDLLVALLIIGFGIKAGVIGLHMWLPLAHPAAPFPASAALSGAMIKAGLVGWVRLLPVGEAALPGWSDIVIVLGVLTAFAGVLLGLPQRDPKVVLAYSSVSQIGFITVLVGVALRLPDVAPVALAGAAVYALHHGLAKAALFLGVGLLRRAASRTVRRVLLLGMVLAAASLTGLPATSGAFAKAWLKEGVDLANVGDGVGLALSLAAAGTTVLMVRLLLLLPGPAVATAPVALGPWLALLVAVLVATAVFPGRVLALHVTVRADGFWWDTTWPVVLGLALALAARAVTRRHPALVREIPAVPAGDLVVTCERAALLAGHGLAHSAPMVRRAGRAAIAVAETPVRWSRDRQILLDRFEAWTTRRRTGGAIAALVAVALLLTLTLPGP